MTTSDSPRPAQPLMLTHGLAAGPHPVEPIVERTGAVHAPWSRSSLSPRH
jgi:hypothetical protein